MNHDHIDECIMHDEIRRVEELRHPLDKREYSRFSYERIEVGQLASKWDSSSLQVIIEYH